jgi:hypothetical protein
LVISSTVSSSLVLGGLWPKREVAKRETTISISPLRIGTGQAVENCSFCKLEIVHTRDGFGLLSIGLFGVTSASWHMDSMPSNHQPIPGLQPWNRSITSKWQV